MTDEDTFTLEVPGMTQDRFTYLLAGVSMFLMEAAHHNDEDGVRGALKAQYQLCCAHPDHAAATLSEDGVYFSIPGDEATFFEIIRETDPEDVELDDFAVMGEDGAADGSDDGFEEIDFE